MKHQRLEKSIFIRYVLKDIKQKDQIESFSKRRILLVNVVTTHLADPAQVLLQGVLIQVESRNLPPVRFLDLPLKQAMTAAELRHLSRARNQATCQPPEHVKSPSYPEVIDRRDRKPLIGHADRGRR